MNTRSNVPFGPPIESRQYFFKQSDIFCLFAFTFCIIHSLLFSYRSTLKFRLGPLAGMWMHVKRLFSFRTDIPRCAFPGFGLFLLFTLCCHGDGEITDVQSWNLGPQETFITVLWMKWALVPCFCRAKCLFCKEVTNEDSSVMNNPKLSFTSTAQQWVIFLECKVWFLTIQRWAAVCFFPCRKQYDASEQGTHSSFFPSPPRTETVPIYFNQALPGNKEPGGSPGRCHHHWWTFAEYQWTKCESEQNKLWWAMLTRLHAKATLFSYYPEWG